MMQQTQMMWSPQESGLWWLDRLLIKFDLICDACGSFKWDWPCHAGHHWHPFCYCSDCVKEKGWSRYK